MEAHSNRCSNIWRVLAVAFLVRIVLPISGYFYTHDHTIFYTGDSAQYIAPARELVAHHCFFSDGSAAARVWNSPIGPAPDIIRTPGYPLLLAVGLLLGRLLPTTVVLQILLSCLTVYIVFRTACLVFESKKVALTAALLYAAEPLAVMFSSLLSTETMFTTILMVGVSYFIRYIKRRSLTQLLVSAGALAASVYARPVGYFFQLILAAVLLLWTLTSRDQTIRRVLVHLTFFLAVFVGITGLWRIRNEIVSGYSGFSSVFSDDMYCNTAASVLAATRHLSYVTVQDRLGCYDLRIYFRRHPEQKTQPIGAIIEYERDDAVLIYLRNPVIFLRIYLEGVIRALFDAGSPTTNIAVNIASVERRRGPIIDQKLMGKLVADKDYSGKELAGQHLRRGLVLCTRVGKNMTSLPLAMIDQMLLNTRHLAETIIGHIKAFSSLNLR